ncbi:hypothetical protein GCM10027199_04250 [Amycolatopsis magusensis]
MTRRRFPPGTLRRATREAISEILERFNPARRNRSCPRAVKKTQSRYKKKTGPASTRYNAPPVITIRARTSADTLPSTPLTCGDAK